MVGSPSRHASVGRRSVLRGIGAGALAWTAATVSTGSAAADEHDGGEDAGGMLVLIYDDSPRTDYTKAFPVHEEYGVPGCVAACPGLMGTHSKWMHPGNLEELHDAGWEIMSHSLEHRPLGVIPVRGDIEVGDTEIVVQTNLHGEFPGDPIVIFDGETETTATVAGRETSGDEELLLLEDPMGESFSAGDGWTTYIRYTDEFTNQILADSKAQLEEWGLGPVTAYVHPYNRHDGYVSEVVSEHYDAVPNRRGSGLNPAFDPDPYDLGRQNFEEGRMSEAEIGAFLDDIASEPDFGILYGHTHRSAMTEARIESTIQMAHERDIEIVTLQTALERIEDGNTGQGGGGDSGSDDTVSTGPGDTSDGGLRLRERVQTGISQLQGAIKGLIGRISSLFS